MYKSFHYRPDIDGLRGIAIIPVVLFHLGIPAFSGGYIGVDIFFVISGYLITSILYREMAQDHFSFLNFYERRVRRLFPAMFTVMAVATLIGFILLTPFDFRTFSQSIIATSLFGANVLFWRKSGYFAEPAELMPLLHTWSLSVEEQFYIAYPLVLILLLRYLPNRLLPALTLLMLLSFVASMEAVANNAASAFYLPHLRAWELLLGALIALPSMPLLNSGIQRDLAAFSGISLIFFGLFSLSAQSHFPGINALYPCLGTALVIMSGNDGHPSLIGRALSLRPLVLTGLISYSLYLWHWPAIVFTKYWLGRDLFPVEQFALALFSLLAAIMSWRYIERPFRKKQSRLTRKRLFSISAAAMLILVGVGMTGHFTNGFDQRASSQLKEIEQADTYLYPLQRVNDSRLNESVNLFRLGTPEETKIQFLVWGDSHAKALAPAFDKLAGELLKGGLLATNIESPPLLGVDRYNANDHHITRFNDAVVRLIKNHPEINTVFLVGRWAWYASGQKYGNEKDNPFVISKDGINGNGLAFSNGLERTLSFLTKQNKHIVFIASIPEIGWDVPAEMIRAEWLNREIFHQKPTVASYLARQAPVNLTLSQLSKHYTFDILDLTPHLCPDGECLIQRDGLPLYKDDDHLSIAGNQYILSALRAKF